MTGDLGSSPLAIANVSVTRVRRKVGASSRRLLKIIDLARRSVSAFPRLPRWENSSPGVQAKAGRRICADLLERASVPFPTGRRGEGFAETDRELVVEI